MRLSFFVLVVIAALLPPPPSASALCSCMVFRDPRRGGSVNSGITRDPGYSPSAAVFIVRDGVKTVLTMEPAYEGPKIPISMIIPVPSTIGRDQVQTVPGSIFRNLDRLTAPRVQHVFPECRRRRSAMRAMALNADGFGGGGGGGSSSGSEPSPPPVEIVDEWALDEYDITVLSANESNGLLDFVRERGLALPATAEPALRAYIETGHRFILATVDPTRAHTVGDRMVLSPLQLSYESEDLVVPVRLGTVNSPGEQELLLYVLAKGEHYEVANRESVLAPTDLRLGSSAAGSVAELYGALMDEQFRQKPGAVVTEFAYRLGHRVGYHHIRRLGLSQASRESGHWTLTRMRHRFGPSQNDDLTLRPADAPLRMERRHRFVPRPWAPRGASGFYVRFLVRHRSCATQQRQRRLARRYATADSMWGNAETPWPGELLLDDVESLGITAGSTAPAGWPPPPPAPPVPVPEPEAVVPEPEPAAPPEPVAQQAPSPPLTRVAEPVNGGGCSLIPHTEDPPLGFFAILAVIGLLVGGRRTRRRQTRSRARPLTK